MSPPVFTQGNRDPRVVPVAEITIAPPGPKIQRPETSPLSFALPAGFTVLGLIVMVIISTQGGSSGLLFSMAVSLPMMVGSYIVAYLNYRNAKRKFESQSTARDELYRAKLKEHGSQIAERHREAQQAMLHNAPDPAICLDIVQRRDQSRMWARQPFHDDFLQVRLGIGDVPSPVRLHAPTHSNATETDPLIDEAQEMKRTFASLKGVPIALPLNGTGIAGLCGDYQRVQNAVRALIVQVTAHHAPSDVRIVVLYPRSEARQWEWLRWLPHVWSEDHDRRYLACEKEQAHEMLTDLGLRLEQRRAQNTNQLAGVSLQRLKPVYIVIVAEPRLLAGEPVAAVLLREAGEVQALTLFLVNHRSELPPQCKAWAEVATDGALGTVADHRDPAAPVRLAYQPDELTLAWADGFARSLAPVRLQATHTEPELPALVTLYNILGIDQAEDLDVARLWASRDPNLTMSVPVGRRAGGDIQCWDVQEPLGAEPTIDKWHGPHALVAGTTSSGKSELLRSLLLSLAAHMHPHEVCFVLLDFRPPGLVDDLIRRLPHCLSTITDLQIGLVPRALVSLERELRRREALFAEAAERSRAPVDSIQKYHALQRRDVVENTPLPYLILVVDEFTRLKQEMPDALDLFVKVAIIGRAFGFRMILATQKPTGVVTGQIETNTEYRASLRVAQVQDSRDVVGDDEAAYFTRPGRVHWRKGTKPPQTYQSAWPGAPAEVKQTQDVGSDERIYRVSPDGRRELLSPSEKDIQSSGGKTQYEALVERIVQVADERKIVRLPGIWLDPLPETLASSNLPSQDGWNGQAWAPHDRWLRPVVGLQDDPAAQQQPDLVLDLAEYGHLFLCSGSAASTRLALRSIVERIARDHSPFDVHLYLLSLGNAGLQVFQSLPHTGAVISANETSRLNRLFNWLQSELARRRKWLDERGTGSLAEYRDAFPSEASPPALLLVIDNLGTLRDDDDSIKEILTELTSRGQSVGIHLIIAGDLNLQASGMWKVLNNIGKLRLALQLGGVQEYRDITDDYPETVVLPAGVAGRGLCKSGKVLECQVVTPSDERDLVATAQEMQLACRNAGCPRPYQIRELPDWVGLDDLLNGETLDRWRSHTESSSVQAPFGLADDTLQPCYVDLQADGPHFLVVGPPRGGKTTALRTFALGLAETYPSHVVKFVLVDTPALGLEPLRGLPHVSHYGKTLPEYQDIVRYLKQLLDERESTSSQGLRPLVVVLVDDYQFLKGPYESVLKELTGFALRGVLWGVHVILAGGSGQISPWDPLPKQVLTNNSGFLVGSNNLADDGDLFALGLAGPDAKQRLAPGRAYFVRHRTRHLVQVATAGSESEIQERVRRIADETDREFRAAPPGDEP